MHSDLEELGRQGRTGNVYGPSDVSFSPLLRMTQTELPHLHSLRECPCLPFPPGSSKYSMELETRLWIPNTWVRRRPFHSHGAPGTMPGNSGRYRHELFSTCPHTEVFWAWPLPPLLGRCQHWSSPKEEPCLEASIPTHYPI